MLRRIAVYSDFVLLFLVVVLALGGFVADAFLDAFQRFEGICSEIDRAAFDLGGLQDKFPKGSKIALNLFSIAATML